MGVLVVRDDDMMWDEMLMSEILPHAQSLGVPEEKILTQKRLIEQSILPVPVILPNERGSRENYKLLNKKRDFIGIVTLSRDENYAGKEAWEVDILVFEKFRGNDISAQALKALFDMHPARNWIAYVYKKNLCTRQKIILS